MDDHFFGSSWDLNLEPLMFLPKPLPLELSHKDSYFFFLAINLTFWQNSFVARYIYACTTITIVVLFFAHIPY